MCRFSGLGTSQHIGVGRKLQIKEKNNVKIGDSARSLHKRGETLTPLELWSKLLVSPLITPIVVPYIIPYITPFKEFRLWLTWRVKGLFGVGLGLGLGCKQVSNPCKPYQNPS